MTVQRCACRHGGRPCPRIRHQAVPSHQPTRRPLWPTLLVATLLAMLATLEGIVPAVADAIVSVL